MIWLSLPMLVCSSGGRRHYVGRGDGAVRTEVDESWRSVGDHFAWSFGGGGGLSGCGLVFSDFSRGHDD